MSFKIPELDREMTQAAVEQALEEYRLYNTITLDEREASITAGYNERFHGPTNTTSDQTANIAIHNVDKAAARWAYCERLERAVRRLHPKERLLIEERYMKEDYVYDWVVYQQRFNPPISAGTYSKIRWKAFYKLALTLDIAVEKTSND
nr:ArpU family phage packaging/lysis transcriptional regulator [Bacillus sp. FJAT-26390]